MEITITITTPLSDEDRQILAGISGQAPVSVTLEQTTEPEKPKQTRQPRTPKAAAPEADADTTPAADDSGEEDQMQIAVKRATELVSSGSTKKVKDALAGVGAKRVSELTSKTLPEFLAALDED